MLDAAKAHFDLEMPDKDGITARAHFEQLAKSSGIRHPRLDVKPLPWQASYVWGWFQELNQARTSNGMGLNPITFSEIQAWSAVRGVKLRPHEVRLIKALDMTYLKAVADARSANG